MNWRISEQELFGHHYRLFVTDEALDSSRVSQVWEQRATAIKVSGGSLRGRGPNKLAFLDDVTDVVNVELWDVGSAVLSKQTLERLEVLKIFGRSKLTVEPELLPRLWFFAGRQAHLGSTRFAKGLRALSIESWQQQSIAGLGVGASIEHLALDAVGQDVSLDGLDAPNLRFLEVRDAEVSSLAGIEESVALETLSLQPGRDGPSGLRSIDLRTLSGLSGLRWLRVGRQGIMRNMADVDALPRIAQVHGYRSFFDSAFLDAPWADPIGDSRHVRRLLAER